MRPGACLRIAFLLVVAIATTASARRPTQNRCLELQIADAGAVVRVSVSVAVDDNPRINVYRLAVLETFRGVVPTEIVVSASAFLPIGPGREYIVLMSNYATASPSLILPLDNPGSTAHVRSMDLSTPRTRDEILAAVRAAALDLPPVGQHCGRIEVAVEPPGEQPIRLHIPLTDRARRLAVEWARSPDPGRRRTAIDVLARFNDADGIDALRAMLADPHVETRAFRNGQRHVYPLRLVAARALKNLNAPFTEPALESPAWYWVFAAQHPLGVSLAILITLGAPTAVLLNRLRRRRRGLYVERWRPWRGLLGAAALASTVLAATLTFYWCCGLSGGMIFTYHRADRAVLAVKSAGGKLQFLRFDFCVAPIFTADWGDDGRDWEGDLTRIATAPPPAYMPPPPTGSLHARGFGFLYAKGVPHAEYNRVSMIQIPFAIALAPTSVLPLLWLRVRRRTERRRRRVDEGRCLACGYDLRHSPARCPECGRAVADVAARAAALATPPPIPIIRHP